MLYELLLSLAGHPSPLLQDASKLEGAERLLSASEKTLFNSVALLAALRKEVQEKAVTISSKHPSTICRAVSSTIVVTHLAQFLGKVLSIERKVLQEDSSMVGAYDNVSTSRVVSSLRDWSHILHWFNELLDFINFVDSDKFGAAIGQKTGSQLIDWLHSASKTGFPQIEKISLELIEVAEHTWLRQICPWLLYGLLPPTSANDFFIQQRSLISGTDRSTFTIERQLLPHFVTNSTANSILFVGKSLRLAHDTSASKIDQHQESLATEINVLRSAHLEKLSMLRHPMIPSDLSRIVEAIRCSLAQNMLEKILPTPMRVQILRMLYKIFLLGSSDFASELIAAADDCLAERRVRSVVIDNTKNKYRFEGMMMKDAELVNIMSKTWTSLGRLDEINNETVSDEDFDLARELTRLTLNKAAAKDTSHVNFPSQSGKLDASRCIDALFDDILLGTPVSLTTTPHLPPSFSLFLTSSDMKLYSCTSAYLLSIRRAYLHLTGLLKLTVLRRAPSTFPLKAAASGSPAQDSARPWATQCARPMRSIWSTIFSVTYFFAELSDYFQVEVVSHAWTDFRNWIEESCSPIECDSTGAALDRQSSLHDVPYLASPATEHIASRQYLPNARDFEELIAAHGQYLVNLVHDLLLDETSFKESLRALLKGSDHMVALMKRLAAVVQSLQAIDDRSSMSQEYAQVLQEEEELFKSLKNVEESLQKALQALVIQLRAIDEKRLAAGPVQIRLQDSNHRVSGFVARRGPGVNRLLMKLDFGRDKVGL